MAETGAVKALCVLRWLPSSPDLTACDIFAYGYVKDSVLLPPLPQDMPELRKRIIAAISEIDRDVLERVWAEMEYWLNVCHVTKGGHVEHLRAVKKRWRVCFLF